MQVPCEPLYLYLVPIRNVPEILRPLLKKKLFFLGDTQFIKSMCLIMFTDKWVQILLHFTTSLIIVLGMGIRLYKFTWKGYIFRHLESLVYVLCSCLDEILITVFLLPRYHESSFLKPNQPHSQIGDFSKTEVSQCHLVYI